MASIAAELLENAAAAGTATSQGKKNDVAGCCDPPPEIVIALFFDGTGNNKTVEAKMYDAAAKNAPPPVDENSYKDICTQEQTAAAKEVALETELAVAQAKLAEARIELDVCQAEFNSLYTQHEAAKARAAGARTGEYRAAKAVADELGVRVNDAAASCRAARRKIDDAQKKVSNLQKKLNVAKEERERLSQHRYSRDSKSETTFNDYSNVTKLHDLYKESKGVYRQYINGVGTFDSAQSDDDYTAVGQGVGLGKHGGSSKINSAREFVLEKLRELDGCKPAKITFDIFGFSRGAALARHFTNVILAGVPDYTQKNARTRVDSETEDERHYHPAGYPLGNLLYEKGTVMNKETGEREKATFTYPALDSGIVQIRFLGLFDTVGSFGQPGNALDGPFILTVPKSDQIKKIVHLVANHERRDYFKAVLVGNDLAEEIVMAGVHSDIGGGYARKCTQQIVVDASNSFTGRGREERAALEERARARGLYENGVLKLGYYIKRDLVRTVAKGAVSYRWLLLRNKTVTNEYANVCLRIMFNKALSSGLPMNRDELNNPTLPKDTDKYSISTDLEPFVQNPPAEVDTKKIWEPYLHLSAVDKNPRHPYAERPLGYYTESITKMLSSGLQNNPEGPRMVFDNNKKPTLLGC